MECWLPADKLHDLLEVVGHVRRGKKVQLRLVKLNFACRIIPMGRVFCRRLAQVTAGVAVAHHYLRVPGNVREDLVIWEEFFVAKEFCTHSVQIGPAMQASHWG